MFDTFNYYVNRKNILIYRSIYAPVKSNMYILLDQRKAVVIDPHESDECLYLLRQNQIEELTILLTHEHFDHTCGINWLRHEFKCYLFCQKRCSTAISMQNNNNPSLIAFVLAMQDKEDGGNRYKNFKKCFTPYVCYADGWFEKETEKEILGLRFYFKSTPGHSHGSCCIILEDKIVFTGDSLILNNPTILRFPESNREVFRKETLPYLKELDKSDIIMPGHGDSFVLSDYRFENV